MGVENILLGGGEFRFQRGDALPLVIGHGCILLRQLIHDFGIFNVQIFFAHLINLDSVCAVKSTMGITRA